MSNPLTWPEIDQLPEFLDGILEGYFYERDVPIEQDTRRKKKRLTKEQLERIFFGINWVANVKYDGTNLAISNDGKYYGRRQLITGTSYQKKDIAFLKEYNVNALYNHLMAPFLEKNMEIVRFFVYGELVINNLYDYGAKNFYGKWLGFGICIDLKTNAEAMEIYNHLLANGYRCNSMKEKEGGVSKITILLNEALINLFNTFNIPYGESTTYPSLFDLVTASQQWMLQGNGEGLVCVCDSFQRKWKIGNEQQPAIFVDLAVKKTQVENSPELDPRIAQVLDIVFAVHQSRMVMGKAVASKAAQKAEKIEKGNAIQPQILAGAIQSALTKFDAPEAFFEKGELNQFCNLITEEVVADLCREPGEGDWLARAKSEITTSVKKSVGLKFGKWKKEASKK